MDKANIIISIIIVLCIAAAVTAYGITNTDNPIFSSLSSMGANDAGNGIGNNTAVTNNSVSSVATTAGSSSSGSGSGSSDSSGGSSSSGSSSGSDSGSSSSDSGSSSSDSGSSSSDSGSSSTQLSYSDAQAIASDAILEDGCYVGDGYYSDGFWYFTVYDQDGNVVDTISVDDGSGMTGRG